MLLYRQYASELTAMIRSGQLRAGERLPSVREAKARRGVSASTVFMAYQQLERDGLVQARPQSGFYVLPSPQAEASRWEPTPMPDSPSEVEISELVFDVLQAARSPGVAPLGSAFPGPELFPLELLARATSRSLRTLAPQDIVENLSPGNARLREHIATRYRLDGMAVAPQEIVLTHGALEGLNVALQVVTQPGDTVVIESPAFYASLQAIERLKLRALALPTDPVEGLDLDALEQTLRGQRVAACWLMPTFQNPLGCLMPEPRKRALVELLASHDVPLIEDDVYGELYFGSQRPRPAKAFDRNGQVLHCGSFSKSLAPGYRLGWIAAGRHQRRVQRLILMTTMATSLPAQAALLNYLERGAYERHLRRLRGALAQRMQVARHEIEARFPAGTRISRPQGGYFLWLQLPGGLDAMRLHQAALERAIGLAPGPVFASGSRFRDCIRLNVGHAPEHVLPALATLGELARTLLRT